jgi:hypothetical protein
VSSLASALSREDSPVVGFLPSSRRSCDRLLGRPVQGFDPCREAVPARRRPPASLPLARPRSPTFAGCHGTPPRLRGFLPRGDRSPSPGVTRPSARFPSSGCLPWARLPYGARLHLSALSGPPMTLSRRSSQNDGRARSPSAFRTMRGMLAVSGSPTHSRFEAFRRLALAMRLLRVSTGGSETVPPDAANLSASARGCKA